MIKLENGKLFVQGEMTDVFEVVIKEVRPDMILNIDLVPNEYTKEENGVETVSITVDPLNETITGELKRLGYTVVTQSQIEMIQY